MAMIGIHLEIIILSGKVKKNIYALPTIVDNCKPF